MKKWILLLVLTNALTLLGFLIIAFHYEVPSKLLQKLGISVAEKNHSSTYSYRDNTAYEPKLSLFRIYKPRDVRIVMLGDSLTEGADWNEMLSRTDIVNRGIVRDLTEGFLHRITDVYTLRPQLCFIMGGINDAGRNIPPEESFGHLKTLVEQLQQQGIRPVLQSTLYVAESLPDWRNLNARVSELNAMLKNYAREHNVDYIDVNTLLADQGALNPIYTYDGVHLLGAGYEIWAQALAQYLANLEN